jgi:hypothetical protein
MRHGLQSDGLESDGRQDDIVIQRRFPSHWCTSAASRRSGRASHGNRLHCAWRCIGRGSSRSGRDPATRKRQSNQEIIFPGFTRGA